MAVASGMLVEANDIVIHFETNDMIDAGLFGGLLLDIEKLAKSEDLFGPEAEVRLAEIRTGSITARLKILAPKLVEGALNATVTALTAALVTQLTTPEAPAAQKAAQIIIDQSVTHIEIRNSEGSIFIDRDNPAVKSLLRERELKPNGFTPEVLDGLSRLVNRDAPRHIGGGVPSVHLDDLRKFEPAVLRFPQFIHRPSRDSARLYQARGVLRALPSGATVFIDQSDLTTNVDLLDADWDLPMDRPIDIYFEADPNRPILAKELTVAHAEVL
ncbi:hypothetical protein NRB_01870 [Novosphingobium sp. 11B]